MSLDDVGTHGLAHPDLGCEAQGAVRGVLHQSPRSIDEGANAAGDGSQTPLLRVVVGVDGGANGANAGAGEAVLAELLWHILGTRVPVTPALRLLRFGDDFKIDRQTSCWVWQKSLQVAGYGRVRRTPADGSKARMQLAHRWYWEHLRGPIPPGLQIDHLCRNRRCVNPDHLEPVLQAENARRGLRAKITHHQAAQIRAADGPHREIAVEFGVARRSVSAIKRGERWAL